ncbi:MAG: phosphodiester glycosidase family protein, partial [Cyanobacteria bacterium J06629_9]
ARSAVGIKADGSVVLMMIAQHEATGGITLAELAEFVQQQGVEKALNLDGGSSSSMIFGSETLYGRLNREGSWVERPVKSVLVVRE